MYGTALVWLTPATLWRPVALALLLQWVAGELQFIPGGSFEPKLIWMIGDLCVIGTVLFLHRHWSDWLLLLPYPAVWWLYTQPETQAQWMALYWITLAQFVIAGPWPVLQRATWFSSHGPLHADRGLDENHAPFPVLSDKRWRP